MNFYTVKDDEYGGKFCGFVVVTANFGNITYSNFPVFDSTHIDLYVSLVLKFQSTHIKPPLPKNIEHFTLK